VRLDHRQGRGHLQQPTRDAVEKAVLDSVPKGTESLNVKALMKGYEFGRNLVKA
jgi:Pyruvate/2-oxoacid:ferredoxin oxidoreductase gamma subunit